MPKETFCNLPEDKKQKIIQVALNEFAEYGFDLSNIQRIIKTAEISRGSFYQYFEDKHDLYIFILKEIAQEKFRYLQPAIKKKEESGLFEFLEELIRYGIEYAAKRPKGVKIAKNLINEKTIDLEKLRDDFFTEDKMMKMNLDIRILLIQPIENSRKRGEISGEISNQTIINYADAVMLRLGETLLQQNKKNPFDEAGIKIYKEFIQILRYGICGKK